MLFPQPEQNFAVSLTLAPQLSQNIKPTPWQLNFLQLDRFSSPNNYSKFEVCKSEIWQLSSLDLPLFSLLQALFTPAIGKSTSVSRLHSLGINILSIPPEQKRILYDVSLKSRVRTKLKFFPNFDKNFLTELTSPFLF